MYAVVINFLDICYFLIFVEYFQYVLSYGEVIENINVGYKHCDKIKEVNLVVLVNL